MANTTNLNLVKPAGTDKALVSVLNSNSDKIDAWAGSTNQALSTLNSKLSTTSPTVTKTENIKTNSVVGAKRNANVVSIYMDVYAVSTSSDYVSIASLSEAPSTNIYFVVIDANDNAKMCRLTSGGALQIHGTVADRNYMGSLTYIVNS